MASNFSKMFGLYFVFFFYRVCTNFLVDSFELQNVMTCKHFNLL